MRAVLVDTFGGPEVLTVHDIPKPTPGPGEVIVKVAMSGVNFIDVYFRTGVYKMPPPVAIGNEAAGTVDSVGADVTAFSVGDRVAYAMARGSYAEYAAVPANMLVKVPQGVELETAAACMLQGMTAHYLTHSTFELKKGQTCLVHAAAGGTGRLIVQMAAKIGARVISTVGSEAKAALTIGDGASDAILYNHQDLVAEAKRLTNGRGVDVVYDSVGQSTFLKSLDCLAPRGLLAFFGQSSGPVAPFDPLLLSAKGSLYLTRPTLATYIAKREDLEKRASDLFHWIADGSLKVRVDRVYPLSDAAGAQRDLEGRKTTGKLLLKP